jgi:hypothetical protein
MFRKFLLLCSLIVGVGLFCSSAMAQYDIKNSYYFMKDDGIFSDEEKDEEAMYVYEQCSKDHYKSTYRDCECVAGSFRRERDNEKLAPQDYILRNIYSKNNQQCINSPAIAASNYDFCIETIPVIRPREKNNEKFCECVANKVAKNFGDNPSLNTRFIEQLRKDAFMSCG